MMAPDSVCILGLDYRLKLGKSRRVVGEDEVYGYVDQAAQVIYADSSHGGQQLADTVIHECLHAISKAMALDLEEKDVIRWTTLVRSIVLSNPDAMCWLVELMTGKDVRHGDE